MSTHWPSTASSSALRATNALPNSDMRMFSGSENWCRIDASDRVVAQSL